MSEAAETGPGAGRAGSAGALLRQAREKQGLHIGALSAAIKVTQRKLEALEADRYDDLPDATFARALAQTVCRQLKIDPAPVLALLPPPKTHRLEHLGEGINETFREHADRMSSPDGSAWSSPAIWGPALLLAAAAVVYLLPPGLIDLRSAPSPAASAVVRVPPLPAVAAPVIVETVTPAPAASALVETVHAAPEPEPAASEGTAAAPVGGVLQVRTSAESWIEVLDGRGQAMLQRTVLPGETLGLDGAMPLKLKIGNAAATQLVFRGEAVDLAGHTRDNVARLELK